MITAHPGQSFEATLEGVDPGQTGVLAVAVEARDGTVIIERATDVISEVEQGTGVYNAELTLPDPTPDGTYLLIWDLGLPRVEDTTFTEDLRVYAAPLYDFLPLASDVASLMRARTTDDNSNEIGDFTETTRPTEAEATSIIIGAASNLAATLGDQFENPNLREAIREAIILRSAMKIELSYWPEQVKSDKSPYAQYKTLYDETFAGLKQAAMEAGSGDEPTVADNLKLPVHTFPEDVGGMVGWETRF